MQGKFHGEISYWSRDRLRITAGKPGIRTIHVSVIGFYDRIIESKKNGILRCRPKLFLSGIVKLFYRVMPPGLPERIIQSPENIPCPRMPAPPDIMGQFVNPAYTLRYPGFERIVYHNLFLKQSSLFDNFFKRFFTLLIVLLPLLYTIKIAVQIHSSFKVNFLSEKNLFNYMYICERKYYSMNINLYCGLSWMINQI
jgi:hypothetical protein